MITARCYLAGAGTQTAALAFGGSTPTILGCTEFFNGSAWTVFSSLITARQQLAGTGTQNAALAFSSGSTSTEAFNGNSWTVGGAMIVDRTLLGAAGTQNAALGFGGAGIAPLFTPCTNTEAYNGLKNAAEAKNRADFCSLY